MCSRRSVTLQPIVMPSRSLNVAIDLRALVAIGFWPVIAARSSMAERIFLEVGDSFADAHVDDDLVERGVCMLVRVAELLGQLLADRLRVERLQARSVVCSDIDILPGALGEADLAALGVGLETDAGGLAVARIDMRDVGNVDRRFLALDAALRVGLARLACGGRSMLMPETTTRFSSGIDLITSPVRPLSLPARTMTLSPFLILAAITGPPARAR